MKYTQLWNNNHTDICVFFECDIELDGQADFARLLEYIAMPGRFAVVPKSIPDKCI